MRQLILRFLIFLAAVWGLEQITLPILVLGIGALLAVMSALHILATPENYNY